MTWFKVDDSFHSHPKVLATSPAALGLWVVAGAWSSANLTEGFVPDHALPRLIDDPERLAKELVSNGLWRRERGGYRYHDWIAYNPTRSEATAARDKMASGGAIGNHRRWHVGRGVVDAQCAYCQQKPDRPPDRPPDGVPESGANPPSRPDPSLSGTGTSHLSPSVGGAGGAAPSRRDRGTRLPDEFSVTDELADWARTNAPLCGRTDHDSFCDYWRAVPGAKGRKVDWPATWKNWMRREQERRQGNGRGSPSNVIAIRDRPSTSDQRFNQAKEAGRLLQEQIDAGKEIIA
jgi:hypothetical protein